MHVYGIPCRWLTDDQVKIREKGLTTHTQLRRVFGGTTHTDPGPNFPYDFVLSAVRDAFDGGDLNENDRRLITNIERILTCWSDGRKPFGIKYGPTDPGRELPNPFVDLRESLRTDLAAGGAMDAGAVAEDLWLRIRAALAG
jgi:hypothetical protein